MIRSIIEFTEQVRTDTSSWHSKEPKWFRGEINSATPLLPTLYREELGEFENPLLQMFRSRASGYHDVVPDVERTDQWLFLAQHVGLPTRLLDWTESALLGLHFALRHEQPVIWMLNPLALNDFAVSGKVTLREERMRQFPLTWVNEPGNIGFANIGAAWTQDQGGIELPVAVYPTYIHARLRAQRSCFTVHGKRKEGLNILLPGASGILKRYDVNPDCRQSMINELRTMGITESVAFPDLDGLAKELKAQFS